MKSPPARGYAIAVASVAAAILLRMIVSPWFEHRISFPFFLLAIIVTGRWGGYRAAWLALGLGIAPLVYFRLHQDGQFVFSAVNATIAFLSFTVGGTILVWLIRSAQVARETAEDHAEEVVRRHKLLEEEIANRQAAERALRYRQQELELALEAGRLGTWNWDMTTGYVETSESNAVIHGRAPDRTRLPIKDSLAEIHPDDRAVVMQTIESAASGQRIDRVAYRVVWPDGSIHWVEAIGRVLLDESGAPQRAMGVCVDFTDRKAADDALKSGEARLQAILDNTTAVIYMKDVQSRYITVNRQWETLFHCSRENILGKSDFDIFPENFVRRFQANDARVRETGMAMSFEEIAPHDDGLHSYVSVKFPIKHDNGEVWAIGGVSTDITELKKVTEALRTERELLKGLIEVQESEKQTICCDIHDGVIQYAAGALMQLEAFRRAHFADAGMALVDDAITSLRRTVNEGRRVIRGVRPAVLDDSGVLAGIEDLIDQLSSSALQAEFVYDPPFDRLPKAIETAIYRVVQEALTNAKKHSGATRARVELRRDLDTVHVEVRDWGRGFDVHAARNLTFGVIGMSERMRLLGGDCVIESQPGAGTRVIVRLPIPAGDLPAQTTSQLDASHVDQPSQTSLGTT